MSSLEVRVDLYGPMLAKAFLRHKLPVVWALAIAATESDFRAGAMNNRNEGDVARGGSYGLCQMSLQTAKALAPDCTVEDLLDPTTNSEIAAMLVSQLARRYTDIKDVAAAYNSGKRFAHAPSSTRAIYVPRILANMKAYAAKAEELEQKYAD